MSGSSLDLLIVRLVPLFTAVAPTSDFKVFDSEPVDPPRRFLCVGWDESGDTAAAQVQRSMATDRADRHTEALDVSNLLSCWFGNQKAPQVRADMVELFNGFDAALDADQTLGGAVLQAQISSYEYFIDRRETAALAQIRFTVTAIARK